MTVISSERRSERKWRLTETVAGGEQVVVLGLGRFGGAVGAELVRLGFDVLGVDASEDRVRHYKDLLDHVVEADITQIDTLRQLGAESVHHAIVAVGSEIEASILATAALDELGVDSIWAKAVTRAHGKILERVGAHHVVYPEHDMGHRVAHMLGGRMVEWFQLDETFALVETIIPEELVGHTLAEAGVRAKYDVTVVCVKPDGGDFTYATPNTAFRSDDIVVVAGETAAVERFARQS